MTLFIIICYNFIKFIKYPQKKNKKSILYDGYIFSDKVGVFEKYAPLQRANFLISKKIPQKVVPFVGFLI